MLLVLAPLPGEATDVSENGGRRRSQTTGLLDNPSALSPGQRFQHLQGQSLRGPTLLIFCSFPPYFIQSSTTEFNHFISFSHLACGPNVARHLSS